MAIANESALEGAERELYAAPLERFVAVRGELSRSLRTRGEAEAAREIAGRRKPSVAVWAVNALAHRYPRQVEALLRAGDEVRRSQAGGDAEAFASAVEGERRAIAALVERAGEVLREGGHAASEANLQRVRSTLQGVAGATEEERERVRGGVLVSEIEPAGFARAMEALGPLSGRAEVAQRVKPVSRSGEALARAEQSRAAEAERDRRLREAERDRQAADARRREERAEARVASLRREAEAAQRVLAEVKAREAEAVARLEELRRQREAIEGGLG